MQAGAEPVMTAPGDTRRAIGGEGLTVVRIQGMPGTVAEAGPQGALGGPNSGTGPAVHAAFSRILLSGTRVSSAADLDHREGVAVSARVELAVTGREGARPSWRGLGQLGDLV